MVAIGFSLLLFTGWRVWTTAHFLTGATCTTGIIVDPSPHPRIGFAAADGRRFEFIENGLVSRPIGASVPVAYDARDPDGTAIAATFWTTWGKALWTLPAGLGFTLLPMLGARVGSGYR